MKSTPHRAPTCRCLLPSLLLAAGLSACAPHIVLNRPASSCSTLIPDVLRTPVAAAPLPADDGAGAWVSFGVAQTDGLDKANEHTAGAIAIVEKCEARDAEVAKQLAPKPWWKVWG